MVDIINKTNDKDAQTELYKRYQDIIMFKSKKYWTYSGDDNDMQQEGLIGLMNATKDYNPEKNIPFKSFAEICVNRQMITSIKTSKRQKHAPLNQYISLDKPFNPDDNSEKVLMNIIKNENAENPEQVLVSNESMMLIMDRLTEDVSALEKLVLQKLLEDKKYKEIAVEINKSIKSVDNAVQRIRKKLAGIVKRLQEEEMI